MQAKREPKPVGFFLGIDLHIPLFFSKTETANYLSKDEDSVTEQQGNTHTTTYTNIIICRERLESSRAHMTLALVFFGEPLESSSTYDSLS